MPSTVVCSWEYSEKASSSKSFKAVHDALVSSQNEIDSIIFQKGLDSIGPKFDNVSCAIGVSDEIGLDAQLAITVRRVTPQNVYDQLLFHRRNLMDNF